MAETTEPRFTSRKIKDGDRWDTIAYDSWGDAYAVRELMNDNPHLPMYVRFPPSAVGETIYIRVKSDPATGVTRPLWFVDEDTLNETLGETDTASVPVTEGPPVPLGFSPGYPRVEGNKILFAINKSARYPYSVEKTTGGVVAESSGYDFASGFPVSTADITDGGYYVVKVGNISSAPLTVQGAGAALAFVQLPTTTKVGNSWQLKYSINKTGSYRTKITNLGTSTVIYDQPINYTTGFVNTLIVPAAGNYKLEIIGATTLTRDFTVTDTAESTTKPSWLTAAGYRYDPNSHDFTMELDATADLEVEVTATVGGNPSGKDQDSQPWGPGIYNKGTTAWVTAPYDERFSFNPDVAATGGLLPDNQYRFRIRRTSVPGDIFVLYFRTPTAATAPGDPTPIDLGEQSTACPVRPTILAIVQADTDNVTFAVDGNGYDSLKWRVKKASDSSVVRNAIVNVFVNGVPQFVPSNQPTVNFTGLPNDDYIFEIEGNNCTSTPHSAPFTVTDGGTGSSGSLEVSLYYSEEGSEDLKCRVNGTAPYDLVATDGTDEIYAVTSNADEISIPNSVMTALGDGRITVSVQDATNKTGSISRQKVDRDNMRIFNVGYSVANGDISNHKTMIEAGEADGFQYTGTIVGNLNTDADFNALKSGEYDHESAGAFVFSYDETVRHAYLHNMKLRCGLNMSRESNKLNNGSTRTQFYSEAALMKRVDGVSPIHAFPSGPVPAGMIPSPSSPEFIDFAKRYLLAFCQRYKKAHQKGLIAWTGMPIGDSAESEYPVFYKNAAGDLDGYFKGDFHPQCVANFKAKHPEYANLTNQQIADADLNGSPLGLDWTEHHAQEYAKFEQTVWDYVYSQIPDLNRDAPEQIDVGSATDELSPFRRTQNVILRCRKSLGLFKINDDPGNDGEGRMAFWLDHGISIARRFSASFIYEPSPQGANFDPGQPSMPYVYDSIEMTELRGGGISWVTSNTGWVDNMVSTTGIVPGALLKARQDMKTVSGDKKTTRLLRNISDVFKTGALGGWETAHNAFRTAQSVVHVDTLSVDDIDPITEEPGPGPGPDPGPGPGPSPGSGIFNPVIMYQGWPERLTVTVTGVGGSKSENWLINATTTVTPNSGYERWWFIDDNLVKQGGQLVDYPYQSNEEVQVMIMTMKIGLDTAFRWANPGENKYIEGFSDPNAGQDMGFGGLGASGAHCCIGFQEVADNTTPNAVVTAYLDTNAPSYSNNLVFDIKKPGQGTVYSYSKGSINRNQTVSVMSLSKAVTAAVMLSLIDDSLLTADTTIADILPDWTGSKGAVKLKEIMNHTSGLPDNQTNEGEEFLEDWVDWYRDQIGATTITTGTFAYRTVPWQVAARMAEVVTGQAWKVLWKERIGTPCSMGTAEYWPFQVGPPAMSPDNPHAGYGLYCTANEYMNFLTMVRDGGVYAGNTVLSPTAVAQLWTSQTSDTTWGFGMIRNDGGDEPTSESQKGCYSWVDRSRNLACLLFTQINDPNIGVANGLRDLVRTQTF